MIKIRTSEDVLALSERVREAQDTDRKRGNLQATSDLIDELAIRTIDGEVIRCGMRVVDYNMKWTTVTGISSVDLYTGVWFKTNNGGMFDGKRLWSRMP